MLIADLTQALTPDFVVHNDVMKLCGCPKAAVVLAKFIWWSKVTERKYPERCGWFYQTGKDFFSEFCLKRRGYEEARKILVDKLGVLEYRRGGVFGRMYWRVNAERLQAALARISKRAPQISESNFQQDRDGFWLPKSIPLDKWHAFLDSRVKKTGKLLQSKEAKIRWVKQLEKLIKECSDVPAFMDYVTARSWANFIMHPSVKWDEVITQSNQPKPPIPRQPKEKPPTGPESPPVDVEGARKNIQSIINKIQKN